MARIGVWPRRAAAAAVGAALGISTFAGGALLLYSGDGFLASAGFLAAVTLAGLAVGVWIGAPAGVGARHPGMAGRWMFAIAALAIASFAAAAWLRIPTLQLSPLGPPLGMVLFLAEPAYALGAVLVALDARSRRWAERAAALRSPGTRTPARGDVAIPSLLGAAAGAVLAAWWLIPSMPPGPVFFGTALLLAAAGTAEMTWSEERMGEGIAGAVVLITGVGKAGQVGAALAQAFHAAGARLVLVGRGDEVEARAAELGGEVVAVRADLSGPDGADAAVAAARERWGRLDVVVNAAGGLRVVKPLADTTPEEWSAEIERNTRTAFLVSRAALPLLRESRGSIVNFASPAAERAVARLGAYGVAKAGVVALTRSLALEEKANGVRVNAIAPAMIDTEQNRAGAEDAATRAWVSREAIVEAALFLASARGVSGEVLDVTHADLRGG